jgi:hypothetical protein
MSNLVQPSDASGSSGQSRWDDEAQGRWSTAALAALMLFASAGCIAPHYRTNELRATRADDPKVRDELFSSARAQRDAGNHSRAAALLRELVSLVPDSSADVFLELASEEVRSGDRVRGRATARFALAKRYPFPETARELRKLLVRAYAQDGLIANALAMAGEDAELRQVPELAAAIGPLLEARTSARAGDPAAALDHYEEFLSAYGVPDSPVLERWRDEALAGTGAMLAPLLEEAAAASRAERWSEAVEKYGLAVNFLPSGVERVRAWDALVASARRMQADELGAPAATFVAEARERAQQPGESLRAIRRAVASAPAWAPGRLMLGRSLGQLGLKEIANRELEAAALLARDDAPRNQAVAAKKGIEAPAEATQLSASPGQSAVEAERWRDRGWTTVSAGGALLVVAAITTGFAANAGEHQQLQSADAYRTVALATGLTGGALCVLGGVFVFANPDPVRPAVGVGGTLP